MRRLARLPLLSLPILLLSCDSGDIVEPLTPRAEIVQAAPSPSGFLLQTTCLSPLPTGNNCDSGYKSFTIPPSVWMSFVTGNNWNLFVKVQVKRTEFPFDLATSGVVKVQQCLSGGSIQAPASYCTTKGLDGRWKTVSGWRALELTTADGVTLGFGGQTPRSWGYRLIYRGRGSGFKNISHIFNVDVTDDYTP